SRSTPGIDSTGSRTPSPGTTNSGWIRCCAESSVSRTRSRSACVRRSRLMRVAGKLTALILGTGAGRLDALDLGHRRLVAGERDEDRVEDVGEQARQALDPAGGDLVVDERRDPPDRDPRDARR